MELIILGLIGILNLYIGYRLRFDDTFRTSYVKASPKAWIWRKVFGAEKAVQVIKNLAFIPMILGVLVFAFLGWLLLR